MLIETLIGFLSVSIVTLTIMIFDIETDNLASVPFINESMYLLGMGNFCKAWVLSVNFMLKKIKQKK